MSLDRKTKLWVFDLDDTIIDTNSQLPYSLQKCLSTFGVRINEFEFDRLRKSEPLAYFASKVGSNRASEAYQIYLSELEATVPHLKPFVGIHKVLEMLKAMKLPIALWTGRDRNSAEKILKSHNLVNLFDKSCFGDCAFKSKPDLDGYLSLLSYFNIEPQYAAIVGDHEFDLIETGRIGSFTIHANWTIPAKTLKVPPQISFNSTRDLLKWIQAFE